MKQVTMESIQKRIADLESAGKVVGGLSLSSEFELACLRELVAVTEQRDAVVVESAVIKNRMQQLVDIINKTDNDYCMCGEAMKSHGHGGCGSPTGMFDYHYGRWIESEAKNPATDAAIASLRAEGIHFSANRLLAAYDQGFINKPAKEVADVARMIITAIDELPTATPEDLTDSYSKKSLEEIARQLRESKGE